MIDAAPAEILTGKDLLNCAPLRSLAPVAEIKQILEKFGAALLIDDSNLLRVRVAKDNVSALNRALLSLGIEQRRAVIAGLPEHISRLPKNYDRQRLWMRIYGKADALELV